MSSDNNPYIFFNVSNDVGKKELKRAYARLLRLNRPDRDPDGFKKVLAAYEEILEERESDGWSYGDAEVFIEDIKADDPISATFSNGRENDLHSLQPAEQPSNGPRQQWQPLEAGDLKQPGPSSEPNLHPPMQTENDDVRSPVAGDGRPVRIIDHWEQ